MQNQEGLTDAADSVSKTPVQASNNDGCDDFKDTDITQPQSSLNSDCWENVKDTDIMQQQSTILSVEADKIPLIGDKEPMSSLAAEYQSGGSLILLEKIKVLGEQFYALRRSRGDGNCFFRSFMFSYLENILESQDKEEVKRISLNVEKCRKTLQDLGYQDFTFEDFFALFLEQLEKVLPGNETSISHDGLVKECRDQQLSNYVVMFFRFVTSGEIRKRAEFFEPFLFGLAETTVDQFCKTAVEPMGEESDHLHIIALSDALGVPIRIIYLDRSRSSNNGAVIVNHHDFVPRTDDLPSGSGDSSVNVKPYVTLLYRPGHYDILYPK